MSSAFLILSILCHVSYGISVRTKPSQVYIDVKPANTSRHLEVIRSLPIVTYQLVHERAGVGKRSRVGPIGHEIISLVPEVVDIVPEQILPPLEKGEEPTVLQDFPLVDDQKLFMYGIGSLQELTKLGQILQTKISHQFEDMSKLQISLLRIEQLMNITRSESSKLRKKTAAIETEKLQLLMDLDIKRVKDEEEYAEKLAQSESEQLKKSEELLLVRLAREEKAAQDRSEKLMQKKLETAMLIEAERAQAADIISALEHERTLKVQEANERMKAETATAIAQAKAELERLNEDVHLRRLKAEANEKRMRNIAMIESVYKHLTIFLTSATENPDKVLKFVAYASLMTAAIFFTREGAMLCRSIIEATVGRPKLIRETTKRSTLVAGLSFPIDVIYTIINDRTNNPSIVTKCHNIFDDLVLPETLKRRIVNFATSAAKSHRNNGPNRHLLLYGQPGTGKTFVARKLAQCVGMDYAFMSGGDVGPLGSDAVTQIHNLFLWASMSRKGVLLFIDEAEAFLASRSKIALSENAHNALNALLYNTGGNSAVLLVLATNRAEDLDAAILDRCDETIYFPLPDNDCRVMLLEQYFDCHVKHAITKNNSNISSGLFGMKNDLRNMLEIDSNVMTDEHTKAIAAKTEGFSGREIEKLMLSVRSSFFSSDEGILSESLINAIVDTKVNDHKEKRNMIMAQIRSSSITEFDLGQNDDDSLTVDYDKVSKARKRYSYHRYGTFSLPN